MKVRYLSGDPHPSKPGLYFTRYSRGQEVWGPPDVKRTPKAMARVQRHLEGNPVTIIEGRVVAYRVAKTTVGGYSIAFGVHGHAMANKNGESYLHRLIAFDALGQPEKSSCHWCGTSLPWIHDDKLKKVHVDHLDRNRANNSPGNLVPSCMRCNSFERVRGRFKNEI